MVDGKRLTGPTATPVYIRFGCYIETHKVTPLFMASRGDRLNERGGFHVHGGSPTVAEWILRYLPYAPRQDRTLQLQDQPVV